MDSSSKGYDNIIVLEDCIIDGQLNGTQQAIAQSLYQKLLTF
jgi:hypothetical protein